MTDTELRRLAENATPGTWASGGDCVYAEEPYALVCKTADCDDDHDMAFIAAASPDVVLGLLDRIKALEVGMNEIAAVHAELRALFQERPIVNMIDEVRKALDRPEISVADASVAIGYLDECGQLSGDDLAAYRRVEEALRAHAAKGGE